MANDLQTNIDIIDDFTQRLQVAVIGAEETTAKHEHWVEGNASEVIQTANGPIKTLRGLIADWDTLFQNSFTLAVQGYDAQFVQKLSDFDQEFVNYLLTIGFEPAIIYQPGITITRRPQTVAYQGVTYYWAGTLPYTTNGNFTSEPDWLIAPIIGGIEIPQMSFASGGTIVRKTQSVLGSDGEWYFWTGSFPKVITAGSTLETAGGVGLNKFKVASGTVPLRPLMKIVATAAGVVLNTGSFEYGATITSSSQVLAEFGTGKIWKWDGPIPKIVDSNSTPLSSGGTGLNLWNEITTATGTSGAGITISENPPSGVGSGHRWYCTADGRTYIKYADGDSVQWVEESPQGSVFEGLEPRIMESLRIGYAEFGYNVVGTFGDGFVITNSTDIGIDETTGKGYTGPIGPVTAGTNPVTAGFSDVSVVSVAFTRDQIQKLLDDGFKNVQAFMAVLSEPVSIPRNATVVFNGTTRLALNGNVFTIVTGSRVYGDFIVNAGFNPTIGYVDGTFRPTMLLADNRRAGIYGTIRSENPTPNARALFLDGNARNGKRGIISWFECDITLRNIARACDVEASNPTGIDGAKSYVNNNYLRISMWDVPYGYIEADIDLAKAEIAANDVHLDYQSSGVSVQIVRNRGTRNNLHGNIWDTDRTAYPSLLSNAVDIGGGSNVVGGANWPSPASNVVVITDTLCKYTGYAYGTAKSVLKPLTILGRGGVEQGNGVEGAIVGQLGSITNIVTVAAGAVLQTVFSRSYGFNANRTPYFIDGYILLKNTTLSNVNVQVKFGPTSVDGALSSTFQIPAQRVKRVDLSLMLSTLRQNATCGDGSWYGTLDYSSLTTHQVHIQITTPEGVTIDGAVLRRSAEL